MTLNVFVRLTAISQATQLSSVGALLDFIVRERALSDFDDEGISSLDVRDIEILALYEG